MSNLPLMIKLSKVTFSAKTVTLPLIVPLTLAAGLLNLLIPFDLLVVTLALLLPVTVEPAPLTTIFPV